MANTVLVKDELSYPRMETQTSATVTLRVVESRVERTVIRFDPQEPMGYPVQPIETEPDFSTPRTIAELAEEQLQFLATIVAEDYVDIDLPDND